MKEKKRSYNQRIIEAENGSFTPLVFGCTGGMSREYGKFYSRLADLLAIKKNLNKNTVMGWLRAKLLFKLLRSVNICIRDPGARKVERYEKDYAHGINIKEE